MRMYHLDRWLTEFPVSCLRCGQNGSMSCDPKNCQPQTLLKKMMIKAAERKR